MMELLRITYKVCLVLTILHVCYAPPVKEGTKEHPGENKQEDIGDYMEYHRYLSEVVQALESDSEFKEKLEKAPEEEIRSGKIADQLEFVSHHVRTKLDEIKRIELERLKDLMEKKKELQENIDMEDPTHKHLDHSNPHTFEIEDLKKLIAKTQEDLAEADKVRKEEFKEYELHKELEKQKKLNSTNGEERAKLEQQFKEQEEKHKKHEKLHEPGHKAQLEEVWQEQDQMQQEFDPKTFFLLHDIDSNGLWDQNEVKALFLKELDKMYQAGAPEDDIRERIEEMERMRETVFKEVDTNQDGFIDFPEFLAQTRRQDFNEDHGWNGIDEQKPYTDEELQQYIARHQQQQFQHHQQQQFQQHPPPVQYQGYQHNVPPQAQFHPGQMPQHPPQQVPGRLPDINTNEIYPNGSPQNNFNQQRSGQAYQQHPTHQAYQQQQAQHNQQNVYQQQNNQGNAIPSKNDFQHQQINQGNVPQQNFQQQSPQQVPSQNNFQNQQVNQGNVPQQNFQQPHVQQVPPQNNFQQQVNQGNIPQQNFQQPVQQANYQQTGNRGNPQNSQVQQNSAPSQGNVQAPVVKQV